MTSFIITYDLSAPGRNYDALIAYIKSFGTWASVSESSWVVVSSYKSAKDIRDEAQTHLDSNDKLYVFRLSGEGAWRGATQSKTDWLRDNL